MPQMMEEVAEMTMEMKLSINNLGKGVESPYFKSEVLIIMKLSGLIFCCLICIYALYFIDD